MKHKYCRTILTFASGVVVGVVGISFWELFGKPVLPKPEIVKHDLTYHFEPEYDGWAEQFNEPSAVDVLDAQEGDPVHATHNGVVLVPEDITGWGRYIRIKRSFDDTQPVKVMDWMKEW